MNYDDFMERYHGKDWVWADRYGVHCQFVDPRAGGGTYWTKGFSDKEEAGAYAEAADKVWNIEVTICEQAGKSDLKEFGYGEKEINDGPKESYREENDSEVEDGVHDEPDRLARPAGLSRGDGLPDEDDAVALRPDRRRADDSLSGEVQQERVRADS